MKLIAMAFYVFFLMLFLAFASAAHADTLDHTVQVVTGAEINVEALANEVAGRVRRAVGGDDIIVTIEGVPLDHPVTIRVMVTGRNVGPRNAWRIRMIIGRAIHADGVARNGYINRPQRPTRAFHLL